MPPGPPYKILVPRIFHRIWVGPHPFPQQYREWGRKWQRLHREWGHRLWTNADVPREMDDFVNKLPRWSNRANIYKYLILLKHGGVFIDCDFEPLKNIEPLLHNRLHVMAYCRQSPLKPKANTGVASSFMAAPPQSPIVKEILALCPLFFEEKRPDGKPRWDFPTGPNVMTQVAMHRREVIVLQKKFLHPYTHDELKAGVNKDSYPEAYAIHHWGSMRPEWVMPNHPDYKGPPHYWDPEARTWKPGKKP